MSVLCGLFFCLASSTAISDYYKGILWEVSNDSSEPSYVFGTFHSDDDAILDLPDKVRKALYFSSVLVMEMSMNPESVAVMQQAATLPDERSLKSLINDNLIYSEVVSSMALRGSPRTLTNRMKPWAIYMSLNAPERNTGMFQDLLLQVMASVQNKPVFSLEEAHEQVAVYDDLSIAEQIELLETLLVDVNDKDREYEMIKKHYLERDLEKLADAASTENLLVTRPLRHKVKKRLVDDRNITMTSRMLPYLERGDAFIAVGALHLPGKKGVLSRLSDNGYNVKPIY